MPLTISVVTAVLNRVTTIRETLASVQSQSWPLVEHVIVDGASTDGTVDILHAHKAGISVLVSEPDDGIYDALNKGIARATGDLVGFLHSDDCFAGPEILARIAREFDDPAVDAVYGDLDYVAHDDPDRVIRRWRSGVCTPARLARGWMPPHPTLYVRRAVFARWGIFDARYRIAADYDLILRLFATARLRAVYIPEVLVRMRMGGASNRSLSLILRKSSEDYRALKRNNVGGFGALCWKNLSKLGQFL